MKFSPATRNFKLLAALILLLSSTACRGEAKTAVTPPQTTPSALPAIAATATPSPAAAAAPRQEPPTATISAGFPGVRTPVQLPESTPAPGGVSATVTPSCQNGLTFIEDVTIPDGTVVSAGVLIDKRWKVMNSGTCSWDRRYRLALLSGTDLGIPDQQALYPARGGGEAVIRMLLTAPTDPGTYRSAWTALDPDGSPFGDPIFIEITVGS